ncbi:hypothetical protein RRG08_003108 [Elysia crispata]|uniref:Uncharacterized protein n=1 Tax=Elysia crispata TaxID=231223 RepID=A0AAE1EBB2_9GAST|nr:hypothetical protein RRG08_003108 [Elysia crispata]
MKSRYFRDDFGISVARELVIYSPQIVLATDCTLSPFSCYTYIPEFANILTTLINMRLERRTGQILTPEATTGPHTYCSVTSYLSHIHTQHDCRHHTTQDLSHFPLKDPHKPLHFISTRAVWSQNG